MNKKIYFNTKFIEFFTGELNSLKQDEIFYNSTLQTEDLKKIETLFLDENNNITIKINSQNFETVLNYFKNKLTYIQAAGGFIKKLNQYLFIYRLDKWDLPKGKLDKGETIEHAAIRECEEECGVKNLNIVKQLNSTYHIYTYKKKLAIKQTFWFCMETNYNKTLIPQTKENITDVKWFTKTNIETIVLQNTYLTITDVIIESLL